MKQGIKVLENCKAVKKEEFVQDLINHFDDNANDINFTTVSKKLAEGFSVIDKESNNNVSMKKGATSRKRKGIPDDRKTMIKAICTSITRLTCREDNNSKRICQAVEELNETTIRIDKFLKDDLRHTKDINKRVLNTSYNKKHTGSKTGGDSQTNIEQQHCNKIGTTIRKDVQLDISHTLGRHQWMHSSTMDKAIKCIRCNAPSSVYIANTSISILLNNWNETQNWLQFASAFRSKEVMMRKPNGVYLIPVFTGMTDQGHWSLAVVHKTQKRSRYWILNSLGKSDGSSKEAKAISKLFSKTRAKCKWMGITCRAQTEVECGSRTIAAMVSIVGQIKEGVQIDTAMDKATLMHIPMQDYDSTKVRSVAAAHLCISEENEALIMSREMELRKSLKRLKRRGHGKLQKQNGSVRNEIIDLIEDEG